jgi:hypothetical protein
VNKELEQKVVEKFLAKERRERYLSLLSNPKSRRKFRDDLCHFSQELNKALFTKILKGEQRAILEKIKEKGDFKDCYLISESLELDARRMQTTKALEAVVNSNIGTLIVFGDAEVVYYEGENIKDRWLSN